MAIAKSPIVIEFFGRNSCTPDTVAQESIHKILKTKDDIILINCRIVPVLDKTVKSFTHKFCSDRHKAYNKKYNHFGFNPTSLMVVNGHLDANYKDVMPTLNFARTDNISSITVNAHDNMLDISVPEISSDIREGDIILYTYMPTIDEKAVFIDSDLTLTNKLQEKIRQNISVPFVTKTRTMPFYLRPILTKDNLGRWRGKKMDITIPLNDITSFSGTSYADLSYIVLIYKGDELGPIIAAGEDISLMEYHNTLPHSEPTNIQFVSQPAPVITK